MFGELLREGTEIVTPMSPAELEQAITEPARRRGVAFEPALVAEMVAEAAEHPAALPLLQYALTEAFERRRGGTIGLEAYRQIGGVSGALADRAEGLYGALDDRGRLAARQVFLRLITVGESGDDTRRRVLLSELTGLQGYGSAVPTVIDAYGRHRLLTFDRDPITRGPTVEVSHEALLHGWARLDGWIEDARSELRDQRKISEAAAEWTRFHRDDAYLLRGPQLDRLAASVTAASLSLSSDEAALLRASLAERDRVQAEEAERERRREEAEERSRRRARLLGASVVVAVVIALLGVFALYQRQQAQAAERRTADLAEGTRLADMANRADDPELALLLALEATEMLTVPGEKIPILAEETMHLAIQKARLAYPVADGPVGGIAERGGVSGVYVLPIADMVEHIRSHLTRSFTAQECRAFDLPDPCPPPAGALATPIGTGDPTLDLSETASAIQAMPVGSGNGRISVVGPWNDYKGPLSEFDAYSIDTGVAVNYTWQNSAAGAAVDLTRAGNPPDVVLVPQPGALSYLDAEIGVIDLGRYLDRDALVSDFGEYTISQATIADNGTRPAAGGRTVGVPVKADVKALVWYPREAFAAAGYSLPESWEELIALSDRIVADGRTPWCVGWDSGPASGWPGTDWIEGLLLRTGTLDEYDRWVAHDIPFDHPSVMAAAGALDQIVGTPGYVHEGRESISRKYFGAADDPMYWDDEPGCWLAYQASFMTSMVPPGVDPDTAGVFPLPPMERDNSAPLLSGGVYAVALTDRPEVRDFMKWLASPAYGEIWAGQPGAEFLSGNIRFDPNSYGEEELRRELGRIVSEAWQTNGWRFDGSDLMPVEIGAFSEFPEPGSFWQGMLDYADGKRTIEQVMHDIEADWVALESNES